MTTDEFNNYLKNIPEQISSVVPDVVAETATEYYKQTFQKKAFDGDPWVAGKPKKGGSLLIASGNMMNSIRPTEVNQQQVVISAGNQHVNYAKAHNEGVNETVTVPAHSRTKNGKTFSVKQHDKKMNIPKRQFMGESKELNKQIEDRINGFIDSIL
jgi:Mu-like prophage protein gpG